MNEIKNYINYLHNQNFKVLTIIDGVRNGKGKPQYLNIDKFFYLYEIEIENESIIAKNEKINMKSYDCIIFNFNEDYFTIERDILLKNRFNNNKNIKDFLIKIVDNILNQNPKITIFNNPKKCLILGDKIQTYQTLNNIQNNIVKFPKFKRINNEKDFDSVNFYPVIIKRCNTSDSKDDTICQNQKELIDTYRQKFNNKTNIMVVEFIQSYNPIFKCFHNIKLIVHNNNLIDYYYKPSDYWKINSSNLKSELIVDGQNLVRKFIHNNQSYVNDFLNNLHNSIGNCVLAIDCIIYEKQLYVCELGLKLNQDTNEITQKFNLNKIYNISYYNFEIYKQYYKFLIENSIYLKKNSIDFKSNQNTFIKCLNYYKNIGNCCI